MRCSLTLFEPVKSVYYSGVEDISIYCIYRNILQSNTDETETRLNVINVPIELWKTGDR